ncbi:MAG: ATP-binding domain-containing protein [Treponema sp.]|nr:ATP-binding domain-containing protein [Treponema sp.]
MAYIVYITEYCQKEAKKYTLDQDLQRLKNAIERDQNIAKLERFGSTNYSVKKKFGSKQGRLISYEEPRTIAGKDHTVIIFLTIMIRGDNDYVYFQRDPNTFGENLYGKIDQKSLKEYLEKAVAEEPPVNKPSLSDSERAYLYSAAATNYDLDNEALICESDQWVKAINQAPFSTILPRIYDTVKDIYEKNINDVNELQISKRREKIIFDLDNEEKRISLIDLVKEENLDAINAASVVEDWKQDIKDNISIIKRAYPQYILADDSLWMDIEKDPQSNFTLSKEEISVLKAFTQKSAFPMFINGRAGSGKSTMLQYLFADYFSRYISYKETINYPPVYFTYNSELLQRAQNFVKGLIKCNTAFDEKVREQVQQQDNNILERLKNSFKELKVYLLSIVPDADREKFNKMNYITFTRFHDLWTDKFKTDKNVMRNYSPDISWHVIRTYIQGMDADGYLDPDDYEELEEKQKTVSRDDYKYIYDKVWIWYNDVKQKNRLWDDQDLARYIIENNLAKPVFPGIFCDEAQDFTRVDMELFFRLSIYSDRDLQKQDISTIPFAFAGDELQTLNPTGFRWEALKAGFTQKFILSLSAASKEPIQTNLNYCELENNYRSLPSIVRFCNTLQLFRAVRFNITGLRPQKPWNIPSNIPVVYFPSNDAVFWENILKITDAVFIIPCEEGQEVEWIKKDPELSKHIVIENDVPKNIVLSANLAKGLEFNRVVVYGFGKTCSEKMINGSDNEDTSVTLPLEYYINKTYVAISRAKKQLIIIDSEDGMKKLWDVTKNNNIINSNLDKINSGNIKHWSLNDDLFLLTQGYHSFLENSDVNMEEIASQFRQNGISSRNSFMLRQAANCYKGLKQNTEASKCEAIAYIFDRKYLEAGKMSIESGWIDQSVKSFWLANCKEGFREIEKITEKNDTYKIFNETSSAIISDKKEIIVNAITTAATKRNELYNAIKGDEIFPDYEMHKVLQDAINVIIKKVKTMIAANTDHIILRRIIDIHNQGMKVEPAEIAEVAYALNDYETAIEYWGKPEENKNNEKYNISRAYCTKYPDNISLFKPIKKYNVITDEYNKNAGFKLSEEQMFMVAEAFIMQKDADKALELSAMFSSPAYYQQLSLLCDKKYSNIFLVLKKLSKIREVDWDDIWNLMRDERNAKDKNDSWMILYIAAALSRIKTWDLPVENEDIWEYLREEIIKKYAVYRTLVIPEELIIDIGTAIEIAGHRRDALEYYKFAETNVKNEELKIKCTERWIKNKEKQAEASGEDKKNKEDKMQLAINKRRLNMIPEDKEFAEFETLSEWHDLYKLVIKFETSEKPPKPDKAVIKISGKKPKIEKAAADDEVPVNKEFEMSGFKFVYYSEKKRLNITNSADGKIICVQQGKYTSDDYTVEEENVNGEVYQHIKDTPVLFKNSEKIELYFSDTKIKLGFDN